MLDTHWLVAKQLSVAVDVGAQIHHTAKVSYAFTITLKNQNFKFYYYFTIQLTCRYLGLLRQVSLTSFNITDFKKSLKERLTK